MESSKEKVFLITGASTGIGLDTARLAAQAGYRLVLAARSREKLESDRLRARRPGAGPGAGLRCGQLGLGEGHGAGRP